jgi:hypothetical protein
MTLLDGAGSDVWIELVRLDAHKAGEPATARPGMGIVAVGSGLVQVTVGSQTPALRHGEVLVAGSEQIDGWRNVGQAEAVLFWIVVPGSNPGAAPPANDSSRVSSTRTSPT